MGGVYGVMGTAKGLVGGVNALASGIRLKQTSLVAQRVKPLSTMW